MPLLVLFSATYTGHMLNSIAMSFKGDLFSFVVTTAFSNYREPETTIVESVTRQRISTSFIVINIENSQSVRLAQLDGIHDVGDRGGLMDNDLMMSEPNMEDDDEMPLMPFFGMYGLPNMGLKFILRFF